MDTTSRFELSGFGDEISNDLTEQLRTLTSADVHNLELRSVWGKNVLDLDEAEMALARGELESHGVAVSAIASPIGKVSIDCDFTEYLQRFEKALYTAHAFGAPYLRVFSFFVPRGNESRYRHEVQRRLAIFTERAERSGIVLLHENERDIYGETPQRCLHFLEFVASPFLRVVFDPANFVQAGIRPFSEAYPLLADYVSYVHIKDAVLEDGSIRLAGKGDGQIPELLADLKARGYGGFLSLEPHLLVAGRSSGFTGPAGFVSAVQALKEVIAAV